IGQGQEQRGPRLLVVRIDREDVQADALRLLRLVEQAVALGFLERLRDRVRVERLQFQHGYASFKPGTGMGRPPSRGGLSFGARLAAPTGEGRASGNSAPARRR